MIESLSSNSFLKLICSFGRFFLGHMFHRSDVQIGATWNLNQLHASQNNFDGKLMMDYFILIFYETYQNCADRNKKILIKKKNNHFSDIPIQQQEERISVSEVKTQLRFVIFVSRQQPLWHICGLSKLSSHLDDTAEFYMIFSYVLRAN